jgi:ketosteroid isomerase-like protein
MKNSSCINVLMLVLLVYTGTAHGQSRDTRVAVWQEEIRKVEKQFETDLLTKGVAYAFGAYAADSAVIKREKDTLIKGKEAIFRYYDNAGYKNAKAYWSPDLIDVSADGTMAYTYGKYRWEFTDAEGKKQEYKGVFHTVWKRQADGQWKYVWD